jgi:hypothetical protein
MISREEVLLVYRLLLDRDPEDDSVIKFQSSKSREELIKTLLKSDEFVNKNYNWIAKYF